MDESTATQNRRHRRSNVLLKATLELENESLTVTLRNLSQEGALVQADGLPQQGTRLLFHRQGLSVPARIAWSHRDLAGVDFDVPLYPRELLRHVPVPAPKPPPPIQRRPGFANKPLSDAERRLIEQWATYAGTNLG
jgi:hypothetical protein